MKVKEQERAHQRKTREEAILFAKGAFFSLQTGHRQNLRLEKDLPDYFALFQLSSTLFVCGGEKPHHGAFEYVSDFFRSDQFGKCKQLAPLSYPREYVSLSGLESLILALGGWHNQNLKLCEKYIVSRNKWKALPCLQVARHMPGSCVLPSLIAFCFCGSQGIGKDQNTIEMTQVGIDEWKKIGLRQRIAKTCDLRGVSVQGKVLVFGGTGYAGNVMYKLDQEGYMEDDLSQDSNIPGFMCSGVALQKRGRVYAVGCREVANSRKWKVVEFDGNSWRYI